MHTACIYDDASAIPPPFMSACLPLATSSTDVCLQNKTRELRGIEIVQRVREVTFLPFLFTFVPIRSLDCPSSAPSH